MKHFITIRPVVNDDHNFLYATYLKNNWYRKENTSILKPEVWMNCQRNRLKKILENPTQVKIACLTQDPEIIVGYGFPDDEKPFVYVKLAYRENKLCDIKQELLKSLEKKQ